MKALLRTLLVHGGLPRVHRRHRDCQSTTLDPLFRQLRRHCRSNASQSDGLQLLPLQKTRRVIATVVEGATSNDITAKLPHHS
jgi:hypothetical protein